MLNMVDSFADKMTNWFVNNNIKKSLREYENVREHNKIREDLEKLKELTLKLNNQEQEILDLKEMYRMLFESLWNGIVILRKENNRYIIKDINDSAERVPYINKKDINSDIKQVFPESKEFTKFYEKIDSVSKNKIKERFTLQSSFKENIHYWFESFIYSLSSNDIVIIFEDHTRTKRQEIVNERKNRLLNCSLEVSKLLLRRCTYNDIKNILKQLSDATDTERVFLFENINDNVGKLHSEHNKGEQSLHIVNFREIPCVKEYLSSGHYICDSTVPPDSKDLQFCERHGIESFCIVPVFKEGRWWGFLGFEERNYRKSWSFDDVIILQTISDMLGVVLERCL